MQETLQLLRDLQGLDEDLYHVKDELRRLPIERDKRRGKIDFERERLAELERAIHESKARIKEIEDMTTSQRQRLRKLENEVNGTADQALIAAYQHEMRSLKRDISEAEEEGLALVEANDKQVADADALRAGIEGLDVEFAEYNANIESEMRLAEERRQTLASERDTRMSGQVERSILVKYEKLLDAREGQAMAMLDGKVCQGCFVNVPSNIYVQLARGIDLVLCPSCGRILYLPTAE